MAERLGVGAFLLRVPSDETSLTVVAVNLHIVTDFFYDGTTKEGLGEWALTR
jgi:hypothetical protein